MKTIMLTKLKSVTTVTVAIMAMIGIGLGLLACRTEAGRQTEGKPAEAVAPQNPKPASGRPTDLQKLAGSWLAVSAKYKGAELAKADREAVVMELVFTPGANGAGGTVARRAAGVSIEGRFTIDPDTVPKRIDFAKAPKVGVYELDGDTLRLCIPHTHTAYLHGIRPTSLDGKDADGLLIVLKRKQLTPPKGDKKPKVPDPNAPSPAVGLDGDSAKSVEVRAGVSGYVVQVACKPGEKVKKGDVLLRIDSLLYKTQLQAAEAAVQERNAAFVAAETKLQQLKESAERHAVNEAELARAEALFAQAKAAWALAVANHVLAKVNLDGTTLRAPVDGTVDRLRIGAGNLTVADAVLVTIIRTKSGAK